MPEQFMMVRAPKGKRCPMERQPGRFINDADGQNVPLTIYYRRRLADGDLVQVQVAPEKPAKKKDDE